QLLAALLNAIRAKGLPPIGSVDGLAFRMRLLLIRSRREFIVVLAMTVAIAVLLGYLLGHDFSEWTTLWNALRDFGETMSQSKKATPLRVEDLGWLSAQIAGSAAALYSLYRGLAAFKIDPAVLLASTAE